MSFRDEIEEDSPNINIANSAIGNSEKMRALSKMNMNNK